MLSDLFDRYSNRALFTSAGFVVIVMSADPLATGDAGGEATGEGCLLAPRRFGGIVCTGYCKAQVIDQCSVG